MSINQVGNLREIQIDTCSANNRKVRSDYGHSHKNLLIKFSILFKGAFRYEKKLLFHKSVFFKHNIKASFSALTTFAALKKRNSNILITLRNDFIFHV